MVNTTQVEQLTPLDLLMPRTYVGAFFTFKTTASIESALPKLQHGLDNLIRRLPWLTGRVFPTSQARGLAGGNEVPRLVLRWGESDAALIILDKEYLRRSMPPLLQRECRPRPFPRTSGQYPT
jgi:hypothetical protein